MSPRKPASGGPAGRHPASSSQHPASSTPHPASSRWLRYLPALVVLLALLVLCWRTFVPGLTLSVGDANQWVLKSHYAALPYGYVGHWAPYNGLGDYSTPIPLTPGSLFAHLVPYTKYADANYLLCFVLMALGGYFLGKELTGSRFAGLVGALWFMLQPHVLSHALPGHIGHFQMAAWIPAAFLFVRRALRTDHWHDWGLAGAAVGLAVSGGTHDVMFFFAVVLAAYGILLVVRRLRNARGATPTQSIRWGRWGIGLALAGVLAGALSYQALFANLLVQIKTDQSVAQGDTGMSAEQRWYWATQWSVPAEESLDFALPGFFGWGSSNPQNPYRGRVGQTEGFAQHKQGLPNLNDVSNYLGATLLLLAMTALVLRPRDPEAWFFAAAGLAGALLSFGKYAPFYRLFYDLPYMETMRNPIKWFYVTSLSAGMLAIIGAGAIEERLRSGRAPVSWLRIGLLALAPTLLVLAGAQAFLVHRQTHPALFWQGAEALDAARTSLAIGGLFWVAAAAAIAFLLRARAAAPEAPTPAAIRAGRAVVVAVLLIELWYVDFHYLPYHPSTRPLPNDPLGELISREPKPFRVHLAGIPLRGYFEHLVGQNGLEQLSIGASRLMDDRSMFFDALSAQPHKLMQLCNVRFLFAPGQVRDPQFQPIFQFRGDPPITVCRFTNELARYFLVSQWSVVSDPAQRFTSLQAPSFEPAQTAIIHAEAASVPAPPPQPDPAARCRVERYSMHRIELTTESTQDAVLVSLDRFEPHWRVFVDDREVPLWRADGIMRACHVPAGKHAVSFRLVGSGFTPPIVVACGLLATIALLAGALRSARPRGAAPA